MQEIINIIKTILVTIIIVGMFIASFYIGYALIIFGFLSLVLFIVYITIANVSKSTNSKTPNDWSYYEEMFKKM